MRTIERSQITVGGYRQILDKEAHHSHEIYEDDKGTLRWRENPEVIKLLTKINLNDLCSLLKVLGHGKNSEVYRKLYRDMGYSLSGYWEIFYWEVNNKNASEYKPK